METDGREVQCRLLGAPPCLYEVSRCRFRPESPQWLQLPLPKECLTPVLIATQEERCQPETKLLRCL